MRRVRTKGTLVALAVAAAALLSACLPAAPPAPPPYTKGFDACAAPSITTMSKWKTSSPYDTIGVYIGGANRGCAQPNLTPTWVTSAWGQGWKLLPIWVGPQASCTTLGSTTRMSSDGATAFFQGVNEAQAAADAAYKLGLGWLTPIYYDMEGYTRGGACTNAVQSFADGWVRQLNARGLRGAMYSSLCSGILDVAAATKDTSKVPLNAIWIAAWNNTPQIFGFGSPCALSDTIWTDHQRVHQYSGGHNESYGGVTINIDSNAVDGPTG
jgi:hypothetical protein